MNCLQFVPKSSPLLTQGVEIASRGTPILSLGMMRGGGRPPKLVLNALSGSGQSGTDVQEEKSETYSNNMTEAMGAVLTYRHELGMNYNFIHPDLIVGSCLQTPSDVDKLREIGVRTIFCLQQNSDLEYFSVDFGSIREYAKKLDDIEYYHAEIRDFDAFDLRMRLPAVVSELQKSINRNGGVTYIHCTAGLGRAPAVALAYMFWVQGYKLGEAHKLLQSKRACFPKLEAIKSATADILAGLPKDRVTFMLEANDCSSVEISGLDIGWWKKVPLEFDKEQGRWILERDLLEGRYEYKYIVDGEWTCNKNELLTTQNSDGHVNNYIQVCIDNSTPEASNLRNRLTGENINLTEEERQTIGDFLDAYSE